jgi:hypothetical protein
LNLGDGVGKRETTIGFGGNGKDVASGDAHGKDAVGGSTDSRVEHDRFIEHGYETRYTTSCQRWSLISICNTLFH